MSLRILSTLAGLTLYVLTSAPATAQGMSLGEFEFMNSCAQCHGADGTGSGPVTPFLRNTPPDLTVLQSSNGGVFPVTKLYSVIEGSDDIGSHGRDMPLWGNRYRARVGADPEGVFSPRDTEEYVQARVLALIEYLATIQKN